MKQFQTLYENPDSFRRTVREWQAWRTLHHSQHAFAHLFLNGADETARVEAIRILESEMPDCEYIGCAASGTLFGGEISTHDFVINLTAFEYPDSNAHAVQVEIADSTADSLRSCLKTISPDLERAKCLELLLTIDTIPIASVCTLLDEGLPETLPVFGGGSFADNSAVASVFSKGHAPSEHAIVMLLMEGSAFHVKSLCVTGWRPLGSAQKVTHAEGRVLHTLNGHPAFDMYDHYLKIPNDDHFFYNALEFPFILSHNGKALLRHALACLDDGSLVMSTDIPEGSNLYLTYGDPETMIESVKQCADTIRDFGPQVIAVFDCFGRKTFWGLEAASQETRPFESLAPTYGFCSAGEFIRTETGIDHQNCSFVVAGMREGSAVICPTDDVPKVSSDSSSESSMSLVSRLANFINTATEEVVQANKRLSQMAITDRLTGLLNRGEIQQRINQRFAAHSGPDDFSSLIMLDLDDFKHVNDTYGHKEGDTVLIRISSTLLKVLEHDPAVDVGRWGGEEFMILLPGYTLQKAQEIAEKIRISVADLHFDLCGSVTCSLGVVCSAPGESPDEITYRADLALYRAKHNGKNQVQCL